jgi:lipoate-protein ligase A
MLIIRRPQKDPYFNLAAEEYLMKTASSDCFMLWQNDPSVMIGKHQNANAEINASQVSNLKIPVVRRISGGGAVYHDSGNINFTFISLGENEKLVDYRKFIQPIADVLNQMGIPALYEGKNDLKIDNLKISGNSEHVYKNRVLHHGTLLFSTDLRVLDEVLESHPEKYSDKSVRSVRSTVGLIRNFLKNPMTIETFMQNITDCISRSTGGVKIIDLSPADVVEIEKLKSEKYSTWQWNFGYSPDYVFNNEITENQKNHAVRLSVSHGIIQGWEIWIDGYVAGNNNFFEYLLTGRKHDYQVMKKLLESEVANNKPTSFNTNILLRLLF